MGGIRTRVRIPPSLTLPHKAGRGQSQAAVEPMTPPGQALQPRKPTLPATRPTIALALGGGGARGLAHILMLEVFDELGLKPKVIAGTSIGALFGAAYASGLSARLIKAHTEEVLSQRLGLTRYLLSARSEPVQRFLNILPIRSSLLKPELLLDLMLPSKVARDFAHLAIPLKVVATDFYAQEQIVLDSGDLRSAIAASMALPALFTPVTRDGRVLMDGGLVNPLPFDVLKGEADITVAIDVSGASLGPGNRVQPTAFSALVSSSQILQRSIVREKLKAQQPDIYIDVEVDEFHVLEFHRFKQVMTAAGRAKEQLKRQLERVLASQTAEMLPAVPREPREPARAQEAALRPQAADPEAAAVTGEPPSTAPAASGPRIALALGGGSARGLAHIVMLEAFDELGVKPVVIAGTSMGSICGACYAAGLSAAEIRAGFRGPASPAAPASSGNFAGKLRGELLHAVEHALARHRRQRHAVRDAAAGGAALRFRLPQDPVPRHRRRFLRHRAGHSRPWSGHSGAGGQLRAARHGAAGRAGRTRAHRRRLCQSACPTTW